MTLPLVRREELKIQQTHYEDKLKIKKTTKPEPAKDEKKWFPSNKTLI